MNTHPGQVLDPVFHFLDGLIEEHGHILYMALVFVSIPLVGWILSGGFQRKKSPRRLHTTIVVIHVPTQPPSRPPPIIRRNCDSPSTDDEDSFSC